MGKIYSVDRDAIDRVLFQLRASAVALIPPLLLFALVSCVGQPCAGGDRRGISIGISEYPNYPERERLQFATMDANRFAQLERKPRWGRRWERPRQRPVRRECDQSSNLARAG